MSIELKDLKCGDIYRSGQVLTECVPDKITTLLDLNQLHYMGNMTEQLGIFATTIQSRYK